MKVSTKGIYALEAMVDLAIHSENGVESIKNIAKRRKLSEKYLEQIIGALRRADLIISTRGAAGGYRLAKPADEITVYEILQATERNLAPLDCLYKETECGIDCNHCATRGMWNQLWDAIKSVAMTTTIADLVQASDELAKENTIEYYI